ncbi:hypothetical protein DRQ18_03555 [bacterium]|nr:MAG: hypothetical protein DRQ18_03555 [bacterium]
MKRIRKRRIFPFLFLLILAIIFRVAYPHIKRNLEGWLEGKIKDAFKGEVEIGRLYWNVVSTLVIEDGKISSEGAELRVKRLTIHYYPGELLVKRLRNVVIEDGYLHLPKGKDFSVFLKEGEGKGGGELSVDRWMIKNGKIMIDTFSLSGTFLGYIHMKDEEGMLEFEGKGEVLGYPGRKIEGKFLKKGEEIIIDRVFLEGERGWIEINGTPREMNFEGKMDVSGILPFQGWASFSGRFQRKEGYLLSLSFSGDSISYRDFSIHNYSGKGEFTKERFRLEIEGDGFRGKVEGKGEKYTYFLELEDFDLSGLRKGFPHSSLSGSVEGEKERVKFSLTGTIEDQHFERLEGEFIPEEKRISSMVVREGRGGGRLAGTPEEFTLDLRNFPVNIRGIYGEINVEAVYRNKNLLFSFWGEKMKIKGREAEYVSGNAELKNFPENPEGTVNLEFLEFSGFDMGYVEGRVKERKWEVYGWGKGKGGRVDFEGKMVMNDSIEGEIKSLVWKRKDGIWKSMYPFSFCVKDGKIHTGKCVFVSPQGKVEVKEFSHPPLSFHARIYELDLSLFEEFLKKEVRGRFSGNLEGVGDGVRVKGKIFGLQERVGFGDSVLVDMILRPGGVEIEKILVYDRGRAEVEGKVEKENVSLSFKFRNSGGWIFYPFLEYAQPSRCSASGWLEIKGKLKQPLLSGVLLLDSLSLRLTRFDMVLDKTRGKILFGNNKVVLENGEGVVGEGKFYFRGWYDIPLRDYKFHIDAVDVPFSGLEDILARVDGSFDISRGEYPEIKGKIKIKDAEITRSFTARRTERKPFKYRLLLEVDAEDGNLWIRNQEANIELKGNVRILYDAGKLLLSGELSTIRGEIYYLDVPFKVERGIFRFQNTTEINPDVDFLACTYIRETGDSIFLKVTGPLDKRGFYLYSRPPRSVYEIIALLNLNATPEEIMGTISSPDALATMLASKALKYTLRTVFRERMRGIMGFDVFEFESGERKLTLGRYISPNLYLSWSTSFSEYAIKEFRAEYKLGRYGSVVAEDHLGRKRLLFTVKFRY